MATQESAEIIDDPPPAGCAKLTFEAFGVPVAIHADSESILQRVRAILPPGWRPCDASEHRFDLIRKEGSFWDIQVDGDDTTAGVDGDILMEVLDVRIRTVVARVAPGLIFVHAGVVAHDGRAILIPGASFSGKTTLVAELVRSGAVYYSDEYAVIDPGGMIHPYARPLAIRDDRLAQSDHHVSTLGGIEGTEPLPVGLVAITQFVPGSQWEPRELSAGEGALALLAHTVPASDRPAESLAAISLAVANAKVLEGDRGEAARVVPRLLEALAE